MLDNLHWADRPSLLLLEFLAHEVGRSRILVVGTYRDIEVSRQRPLSETLGNSPARACCNVYTYKVWVEKMSPTS